MTARPIVALDIGSTKVAAVAGLPHDEAPGGELLGTSLITYPTLTDAWLGDPLMVGRAIEQAVEALGLSRDVSEAYVAMSCPSLTSEQVHADITLADEPIPVRGRDLERLAHCALSQALSIDREPLLLERLGCAGNGFEGIRDPRNLPTTRLRGTFHIVMMPTAVRRLVGQAVGSAGLEIAQLTHTLPALLASVENPALNQQRALLVDVGGLTTDLGVMVGGVLHRSMFLSWGTLTCALAVAKELSVTLEQALRWVRQGMECHKPDVRLLLDRHWSTLREAIERLLKDQPRPDAALVGGRGGLIDGFVEWVEQTTGLPTQLCRSPRTSTVSDLARQVGVSAAIGLFELSVSHPSRGADRHARFLNRLLDRTRTILTEYF